MKRIYFFLIALSYLSLSAQADMLWSQALLSSDQSKIYFLNAGLGLDGSVLYYKTATEYCKRLGMRLPTVRELVHFAQWVSVDPSLSLLKTTQIPERAPNPQLDFKLSRATKGQFPQVIPTKYPGVPYSDPHVQDELWTMANKFRNNRSFSVMTTRDRYDEITINFYYSYSNYNAPAHELDQIPNGAGFISSTPGLFFSAHSGKIYQHYFDTSSNHARCVKIIKTKK